MAEDDDDEERGTYCIENSRLGQRREESTFDDLDSEELSIEKTRRRIEEAFQRAQVVLK